MEKIYEDHVKNISFLKIDQKKQEIKFMQDFKVHLLNSRFQIGQKNIIPGDTGNCTIGDKIYNNQKQIKTQISDLNKNIKNIEKSSKLWQNKYSSIASNIKNLGDTCNFVQVIESRISKLESKRD